MKTYVITLLQVFPATHPRKGEPTNFKEQLLNGIFQSKGWDKSAAYPQFGDKLHTIRANYPLWQKRFEQIDAGEACLSIRQWSGKPYQSKQVEIARLTKDDGIGLQKMYFGIYNGNPRVEIEGRHPLQVNVAQVANNDGLTKNDWVEWFKECDGIEPLAIIHFTKFRY